MSKGLEVQSNSTAFPFIFKERIEAIMENYPSNGTTDYSNSQQNEIHVDKVITGEAVVKVKKPRSKLMETLLPGADDISSVKDFVINEVLIPKVKDAINDAVMDALGMIIFKDKDHSRRVSSNSNSSRSYVSYNNSYVRANEPKTESKPSYCIDDIFVDTMGNAEAVLKELRDNLTRYKWVPVANLYEAVGVHPRGSDYDFGWRNLNDAYVVRRGADGYSFHMPKPVYFREEQ